MSADSTNLGGELTWKTSDASIASISSTSGKTITVTGETDGVATITAYDSSDENVNAECVVTVKKVVVPTDVSISGKASEMTLTEYLELSASVTSEDGEPSQSVVWSSANTGVATVDENGKITPVAVGTTTISVHPTGYAGIVDSFSLEVIDPIYKMVTSIDQLEDGDTVAIGAYYDSSWYIMGTPSTNAPSDGKSYWQTLDEISVSDYKFNESTLSQATTWTLGIVSEGQYTFADQYNDGKYLGSSGTKSGLSSTKTVNAKWGLSFDENYNVRMVNLADAPSTFDFFMYKGTTAEFMTYEAASHEGSYLRLFKSAGKGIAAASATTSVDSITVTVGKKAEFTFEVTPGFNTDAVSVSSSDVTKATVAVDGNKVTVNGVAAGSAEVRISNSADNVIKSVSVTVEDVVAFDHIKIDTSTMEKEYTHRDSIDLSGLKAYAYVTANESDDPVDITLDTEFTSNPATAATVGESVNITVSASYMNGDVEKNANTVVAIKVNPILATGVTFTYEKTSYDVGSIVVPTAAIVTNENASDRSLTITSSDPTIVRVNDPTTGELEFLKAGNVRITATANDGSGESAYVDLKSVFVYPIDRYLNVDRVAGISGSYSSGTWNFDGVDYSHIDVLKNSGKIQFKKSSGLLKTDGSLGGAIKSITLLSIGGTGTFTVSGSSDGETYETISGSNGVYTPSVEKSYSYFKIENKSSNMVSCSAIHLSMRGDFAGNINAFASEFSSAVGDNCATFRSSMWGDIESLFDLLSDDEKAACATITVSDLENAEGTILDQAMRRYDNIIKNYGLKDFVGRNGGGISDVRLTIPNNGENNHAALAISSISAIGLSSAIGFAFLRRKKEDR